MEFYVAFTITLAVSFLITNTEAYSIRNAEYDDAVLDRLEAKLRAKDELEREIDARMHKVESKMADADLVHNMADMASVNKRKADGCIAPGKWNLYCYGHGRIQRCLRYCEGVPGANDEFEKFIRN